MTGQPLLSAQGQVSQGTQVWGVVFVQPVATPQFSGGGGGVIEVRFLFCFLGCPGTPPSRKHLEQAEWEQGQSHLGSSPQPGGNHCGLFWFLNGLFSPGVTLSGLSHMDTELLLSCPLLLCKGEINFDLNLILTEDD